MILIVKRISKNPQIRSAEILDTAEKLFITNGYHKTSITDITQATGVAKSTFFYYFKTKEAVLKAIVKRLTDAMIQSITEIVQNPNLIAIEKLELMLLTEFKITFEKKDLVCNLHEIPNADIHLLLLTSIVQDYTPLLARVLEQGNQEGVFKVIKCYETAELLHVGIRFLFDPSLFPQNISHYGSKLPNTMLMIECLLGAPEGTFKKLTNIFLNWYQNSGNKPFCF